MLSLVDSAIFLGVGLDAQRIRYATARLGVERVLTRRFAAGLCGLLGLVMHGEEEAEGRCKIGADKGGWWV